MGLLNFFIRGEQVFFANHRSDIERFAREIAARCVRPEFEVYSAAMLEEVAAPALARHPRTALRRSTSCCTRPRRAARAARRENLLDMVARLPELPVPHGTCG